MDLITENLITILIMLPVFGALFTLGHALYWKHERDLKSLTLIFTVFNFLVSLLLLLDKGRIGASGFYFERKIFRGSKRSTPIITSALTAFRSGSCF